MSILKTWNEVVPYREFVYELDIYSRVLNYMSPEQPYHTW